MKATEDETLIRLRGIYGDESMEIILKKVLDDYEKARKWDYLVEQQLTIPKLEEYRNSIRNNHRLRELIEKRIELLKKDIDERDTDQEVELQKLLEDSKK